MRSSEVKNNWRRPTTKILVAQRR